jgi:hypothetical protein
MCVLVGTTLAGTVRAQSPADYRRVSFSSLIGFDYNPQERTEPTPHKIDKTIPASVTALDGQRITISGATMPLDFKSGVMTEFILGVSVDTCDFGATPRINEWISVTMAGGKKTPVRYQGTGTVKGVFHVKEMVEGGRVVRLYSIDADSLQ